MKNFPHKLFKTIRQAEKVGSNSSLYIDTKKSKNFLIKKNVKIIKRAHTFKSFASTYYVEIFNFFDHGLNLKDTESAIKNNLKNLLSKLREFKFAATLVLV